MKLLLLLIILFLLPPKEVQAFEEPLAGISPYLEIDSTDLSICYYSTIYRVDAHLVKAIITCESEGNVRALNHNKNGSHDKGLMQINSCNFDWLRKELGITDFYDPRQNIQCGCYILGLLSQKYSNVHRVLMSYNMGEKRTRELRQQGIYSSRYSRKVISKYQKLKGEKSCIE
jgi:soluble lytic murein transglycosylase-like protein